MIHFKIIFVTVVSLFILSHQRYFAQPTLNSIELVHTFNKSGTPSSLLFHNTFVVYNRFINERFILRLGLGFNSTNLFVPIQLENNGLIPNGQNVFQDLRYYSGFNYKFKFNRDNIELYYFNIVYYGYTTRLNSKEYFLSKPLSYLTWFNGIGVGLNVFKDVTLEGKVGPSIYTFYKRLGKDYSSFSNYLVTPGAEIGVKIPLNSLKQNKD